MVAESMPWMLPESTLAIATSQIGQGAWTRSSISRVKPNSWESCSATDCTPWNMIEIPTTPGTRTVANEDSPPDLSRAPDRLADLREDVEEDEAEQEGLHERADRELEEVLAQHGEVAQQRAPAARSGSRRASSAAGAWRRGRDS